MKKPWLSRQSCVAACSMGILLFGLACRCIQAQEVSTPNFTFPELVALSSEAHPGAELDGKLTRVLNSVAAGNFAETDGVHPARPQSADGRDLVRAVFWNIERGQNFNLIRLALSDPEAFTRLCAERKPHEKRMSSGLLAKVRAEADLLRQGDVILLNEVDLGMKRSGYRDVARELARALRMNFVYGVEFVEVDPLTLGTKSIQLKDQQEARRLQNEIQADPIHYKGLHGNAILSRYPIRNTRSFRLPVCHDWYSDEMKPVPSIEKLKRVGSDKVFLEQIVQERRRGGRMALTVDLAVPGSPTGVLTVVNTHLEDKCKPDCRRRQMNAILEHVQNIRNPVVLAGDMNTSGGDGSILSVRYLLQKNLVDYRFWGKQVLKAVNPLKLYGLGSAARYFRNYGDPTARDIPVIANNRERHLFNDLREFTFEDGSSFDFRGESRKTVNGTRGTLADSNQRARKGFTYTFSLPRDYGGVVGRYRLDWFFVKPAGEVYFAPEFPRTMQSLNQAPRERISDHAPITVDLPVTVLPKSSGSP